MSYEIGRNTNQGGLVPIGRSTSEAEANFEANFIDIPKPNDLRLMADNTSDRYRMNLEVLRAV